MKKDLKGRPAILIALLALLAGAGWLLQRSTWLTFRKVLRNELYNAGYDEHYVQFWFSVAAFETGNFTSRLFKSCSNPWGMKMPRIRETAAVGTCVADEGDFAKYANLKGAAQDIVLYMRAVNFNPNIYSIENFVTEMQNKGYFTADYDEYLNGVKRYYDEYF